MSAVLRLFAEHVLDARHLVEVGDGEAALLETLEEDFAPIRGQQHIRVELLDQHDDERPTPFNALRLRREIHRYSARYHGKPLIVMMMMLYS